MKETYSVKIGDLGVGTELSSSKSFAKTSVGSLI
jgi:hypothetical protein